MSFIAILLGIVFELTIKSLEGWRQYAWFATLTDWVLLQMQKSRLREGPVTVLAILAPVVIGVWLVSALLTHVWVVFGFVFAVFVLLMSLGPIDPMRQARDYLHAMQSGEVAEANRHAEALCAQEVDDDPVVTAERVKQTLLIRICENILGIFFWFLVLGPVGAVLFRATCLLRLRYDGLQGGLADAIVDMYRILMWIPARLTVLAFAVVGGFVETLQSLQHFNDLWRRDSESLLVEAGLGAIPASTEGENQPDLAGVQDVLALSKRAVIAWITVMGLMVIVGWLI
ncbi:MAG: regulatory signaling modulator protein AmpE [Gammaproteobacteria bacterium]|jgi:membrane protein required for beta-lactamase induction